MVVDTFQQGAETLIEAQKSFLDATTKSFAAVATGKHVSSTGEAVATAGARDAEELPESILVTVSGCIVVFEGAENER